MTDDELARYAPGIDAGKMEHWTLRWPGVVLRAFVIPIAGGSLALALELVMLWWLG